MAGNKIEPASAVQGEQLRILFVCTANVCRSAMADGLMRLKANEHDLPVAVASAGLLSGGREVDRRILERVGPILEDHVSREINEQLVRGADFILTMTADHVLQIVGRFPEAMPRTHTIRQFLRHIGPRTTDQSLFDWAKQSNSAARHNYAHADAANDIEDPVQRPNAVFDALLVELSNAVTWIGHQLSAPKADGRGAHGTDDLVSFLAAETAQGAAVVSNGEVRPTSFSDLAARKGIER